ncbi:MAG: hypothetical protein IKZ38_00295 [Clostridia bacterium]|nr:hypothetical protein [Clostridia bacterium]
MQDFNSNFNQTQHGQNDGQAPKGLMDMVRQIASKFDGKDQNELLKAIYLEAEKGKRNGTLTNAQLDAFANMLYPFIDAKKQKLLSKIVEELKKI